MLATLPKNVNKNVVNTPKIIDEKNVGKLPKKY
jgi:hypothetical protein